MKKVYIALCIGLLCTAGCVCRPTDPDELAIFEQNNDPFEPTNRAIWEVNMFLDEYLLEPAAKGYRFIMPDFLKTGFTNFFDNLRQPVHLANALLQGEGEAAWNIFKRLTTNTFIGFFGTIDVASEMEIQRSENDFGQTLAVWGFEEGGPYIVLPLFGPSNPRDAIGLGVDGLLTPADWVLANQGQGWEYLYGKIAVDYVQRREGNIEFYDSIKKGSTDFYATTRSMYQQNRKNKIQKSIHGEAVVEQKQDYEFDFDIDE
ncbi:MAG: VacJ family lipoprotein [Lactobacillales bacterium]|jgi:phospholipid-binding lipoprotein MlaA|nr:VacJ family lipoprotein [Lactobacillales bacterium]